MIKVNTRRRRTKTKSAKKVGSSTKYESCNKEDIAAYVLPVNGETTVYVPFDTSSLPDVPVPCPDDAALPKSSLCSLNSTLLPTKDKVVSDSQLPQTPNHLDQNMPCNDVSLVHVVENASVLSKTESMTGNCINTQKPNVTRIKPRKNDIKIKNHQLTEYFPVRRSCRKPLCNVKKEKQKRVEEAIISGKEEGFEIKEFPDKGRGIITTSNLKRGDFVLEYYGELINMEEAKRREEVYAEKESTGCYMYYFKHENKQYCVDATKESGRLGRLINHSKKGNLKTRPFFIEDKPHLILVASRDIAPGEELLYDYGDRSKESLESHPWLAL